MYIYLVFREFGVKKLPCLLSFLVLQVLPTPKSKKPTPVSSPYPSPKRVCEGCPSGRGEGESVWDLTENRYNYSRTGTR